MALYTVTWGTRLSKFAKPPRDKLGQPLRFVIAWIEERQYEPILDLLNRFLFVIVFSVVILCSIVDGALFIPSLPFFIIFLFAGRHTPIIFIVGLEIITARFNIDLGQGFHERFIWTWLLLPVSMLIHYCCLRLRIHSTRAAIRRKFGERYWLSMLSEIFYSLPANATETTTKISDSSCGKDIWRAERNPELFFISIHAGVQNTLQCRDSEAYLESVLSSGNFPPDITHATWNGTESLL